MQLWSGDCFKLTIHDKHFNLNIFKKTAQKHFMNNI